MKQNVYYKQSEIPSDRSEVYTSNQVKVLFPFNISDWVEVYTSTQSETIFILNWVEV